MSGVVDTPRDEARARERRTPAADLPPAEVGAGMEGYFSKSIRRAVLTEALARAVPADAKRPEVAHG